MSECAVVKVTPQSQGPAFKSLVNIYTMEKAHYEDQAIFIKNLYDRYKARRLVIDANGAGLGLIDYMVKKQIDREGNIYRDFGVENDDKGDYKQYRTDETEYDAMHIINANVPFNSEMYTNLQSQISSGKLKLLIDDRTAQIKLLNTVKGKNMTPDERATYLRPFKLTSVLKEQLMNLREETEGINIILKQANRTIKKDKVSALGYALWYIKQEEEKRRKRRSWKISDFMFMG